MFLQLLIIIAIFGNLEGKPIIARTISDCSITDDGILHYQGKHSFTKFEHECLPWTDQQTMYPDVVNEPNFFNDASIKAANNYCRNPNMNINGPWCFVRTEDAISMEGCNVCQSLASRPTLPTDIEVIDEVNMEPVNHGFFHNMRDEMQRYGMYIRERIMKMFDNMKNKMRELGSRFSDRFNFNG